MRTTKQLRRIQCVQRAVSEALSSRASGALFALLAAAGACPVFAADGLSGEVDFDIPSQSIESALLEFSKQADVQVMIGASSLGSQKSSSLKGKQPTSGALKKLLQDTGLVFEVVGNTVTVKAAKPAATDVSQRALVPLGAASADVPTNQESVSSEAVKSEGPPIDDAPKLKTSDEVVVTGSNIRGEVSAGSQIQVLERSDIDATGYATIQDVLNTVPQNVGGAPSEDFAGSVGNYNLGSGVNLRGLGSDATLVLVNGRRQAVGGTIGDFVDISSVPTSAVQRVELLTDGASAIYGADAVGGVVNIILRDDYDGAETKMRLGSAGGDAKETQLSQVFGKTWHGGNALVGYQFYDRDALARADRAYSASADQRRFGGDDFRLFVSNPGNILDPITFAPAYAIPFGQDGSALTPADLRPGEVHLADLLEGADLLPQQRVHAAFLNASHSIGETAEISVDARYSHRKLNQLLLGWPAFLFVPRSNPFFVDPFGESDAVIVAYSMRDDLGPVTASGSTDTLTGSVGAALDLPKAWRARASASYAKETMEWTTINGLNFSAMAAALADPDPTTAFNPFGDGSHTNPATLDKLRSSQREHSVSSVSNANVIADGHLFYLPGGPAKLAVGLDYRDEDLSRGTVNRGEFGRQIFAGFAELALPLVGVRDSARSSQQRLEFSIAARYEDYSDFGTTVNPKIGITWAPYSAVRVRGTWGTSFKAPKLIDLDESPRSSGAGLTSYVDPLSPTGRSVVLVRSGNNSALKEETATIWTAGIDMLWSDAAPVLSLTYFNVDFKDRILVGGPAADPASILLQEDQWAELVRRNPSQADIAAICNSPSFSGNPNDCSVSPPVAIIDFRLRNLGAVEMQGVDLSVSQRIEASWGSIGVTLNGSYLLHYLRAASERSPRFDIVDTVGNPSALRLRGGLAWQRQGWSANVFINHTGAYTDDINSPNRPIASWTTFDLRFSYHAPKGSAWFSDVEVALSAANALDKAPPFYNSQTGYDAANADLLGRMVSAQITKSW